MGTTACMGGELSKLIIAHTVETEVGNFTGAEAIFKKISDFINFGIATFGADDFY